MITIISILRVFRLEKLNLGAIFHDYRFQFLSLCWFTFIRVNISPCIGTFTDDTDIFACRLGLSITVLDLQSVLTRTLSWIILILLWILQISAIYAWCLLILLILLPRTVETYNCIVGRKINIWIWFPQWINQIFGMC